MITRYPSINRVDPEVRSYSWVSSQYQRDVQAARTVRRIDSNRVECSGQGYTIVWQRTNELYIRLQTTLRRNGKGRWERTTVVHKGRTPQTDVVTRLAAAWEQALTTDIDPNLHYEGAI